MTIDGNKIRQGDSLFGKVLATVDGDKVIQGEPGLFGFGDKVIATIDGKKVREGNSVFGKVIATVGGGRMSGAAAAVYLLLM